MRVLNATRLWILSAELKIADVARIFAHTEW